MIAMPLRPFGQYLRHSLKYKKAARATSDPRIQEHCLKNAKRFRALAMLSWRLGRKAKAENNSSRP
jgi:hypothetical protein